MNTLAALDCLKNTGVEPLEIDVIACITKGWKEYPLTTSACYVQDRIGVKNAWDIEAAKQRGEIRPEISSEVLAWTLKGASNFLGPNWGLFTDHPTDTSMVVESFMHILGGGIFADRDRPTAELTPNPIRIEVEFDDDDEGADKEEPVSQ